jgi:hypothetical protein
LLIYFIFSHICNPGNKEPASEPYILHIVCKDINQINHLCLLEKKFHRIRFESVFRCIFFLQKTTDMTFALESRPPKVPEHPDL